MLYIGEVIVYQIILGSRSQALIKDTMLKVTSIPELSRAEDFRASSSSFNLLVAIAASSVFL